jgi:hypothetical protein
MTRITSVGIANIVDVISHQIDRTDRATSHHVVFSGGGEARLSYRTTDGKLLQFTAEGARVKMTKQGAVTLSV